MRSTVRTRAAELLRSHIRTWSVAELSVELDCSYDFAKVVLREMTNAGTAQRIWRDGRFVYWGRGGTK